MAIVWGAYVHASGGYGMRVGIETTVTPVTHASKSSTATYKVYTQNDGTWDPPDRQVIEFDGNYNLPEQFEFDNVGTSATNGDIIHRVTKTYTYVYGPNTYGTTALPQNADLVADVIHTRPLYYPHCEVHVPFPVRPYGTPAVPTTPGVSRVSDTSNKITWDNKPTVGEPYTAIWLERYIYNYATWARIATLGATVETYSDTGAVANRKYSYRVQADNTVGTSGYAQTAIIYTTPAVPTAPARSVVAGNQVLTWALAVGYTEYQTEVWRSENDAWSLLTTLASGVTTYTDTTASTDVRTKYRFRTKTSSGTVLYSAYTADTTETSGIPTAPAAPTPTKPITGTIDPTGPVVHTWTHNTTDGSLQTAFEVQYRHVGSGTWLTSGKITSSAQTWTMPKNSVSKGNQVEWQVRTYGFSASLASPWSASAKWMTTPAIPLKYPMYLDVDTGQVEANSHVTLITEQTRRVATVTRTANTTNATAAFNVCTYTFPATLARTGKKFRITAGCNIVPDTAGMYTDLRLYVGVGATTTGTQINAHYSDHRIVGRSVGATFVSEWIFDTASAGGENISTINLALVCVPGGGGCYLSQSAGRPAYLIIDEIIEGSSTAGGGGGSGVPPGGTDNQVLTKQSDTDGDADWEDPQGGGVAVVEPTYAALRRHAAATSILDRTVTVIPFDTMVNEDGITWDAATSSFVVPVDGYYNVEYGITYAITVTTGLRIMYVQVDSVTQTAVQDEGTTGNVAGSVTLKVLAGQKIRIVTQQTSGSTITLAPSAPTYTYVGITKVPTLSPGGGGIVVDRPVHGAWAQTTAISTSSSTLLQVPMATEIDAPVGGLVNVGGLVTIPEAGYYQINAQVSFTTQASGSYRNGYIQKNNLTIERGAATPDDILPTIKLAKCQYFAAGDTVRVCAYQTSGTAVLLEASNSQTNMDITKVPAAYAGSAVSTYGERNYSALRRHAAALSVPTSTQVGVPWDTTENDGGIPWDGAKFTVPVAGYYQITTTLNFSPHASGYRQIRLMINGATIQAISQPSSQAVYGHPVTLTKTQLLAAGDTISINVQQTSGVTLTLNPAVADNWISITKVPAPVINGAAASGVWGVGPLAGLGADDLIGREIYIDSKGQLRTKPITPVVDTGWVNVPVSAGFGPDSVNLPRVRKIGNVVYARGAWNNTGLNASNTYSVGTIPAGFEPVGAFFLAAGTNAGNITASFLVGSGTGNGIQLRVGPVVGTAYYVNTSWLVD